jgi:tetratricopeptide (TPR) repeat protein
MSSEGPNLKARLKPAIRAFAGERTVQVRPGKLCAFLEETRDIDAPPANRLRWLAIGLENDTFENGWTDLRSIYQAAARADPTDPLVLHSWGISATRWIEDRETLPLPERKAIAEEAEQVFQAALALSPGHSRIAHSLGMLCYDYPCLPEEYDTYQSRAIDWFSRAAQWDPENVIAQLYLAHCFHDRKDWPRAIAEYEKVDLDRLARDWPAWRAVKCREQLAQCHAYAGNTAEAVRRFTAFLDEAESWEKQAEDRIVNLDELVRALTDVLDQPELLRRTCALVRRLGFEKRYRQLALV